jgi:hypothetical protein
MALHSDYLAQFQSALDRSDVPDALSAARGMADNGGMDLMRALALIVLLARQEDPRFERMAVAGAPIREARRAGDTRRRIGGDSRSA